MIKLRIRGKTWTIRDAGIEQYGKCYPTERLLEIGPTIRPKKRLAAMIHELLHAVCPYLAENEVAKIAKVLANGLWRDKWRKNT